MSFDQLASNWDTDPKKVNRAKSFAEAISNFLDNKRELTGIEFGCGTGLLSFELKDLFKSVTLIDTSEGMIEVLREKIQKNHVENFHPLCADILEVKPSILQHDVMYMSMAFHHVNNTSQALDVFNRLIAEGGYLCIGDIVKEDGSFHKHVADFDGHNGFDKAELSSLFEQNGFKEVFYDEVYVMEKEVDDQLKKFPLFLMIGQKGG